jgi:hypothetical protein
MISSLRNFILMGVLLSPAWVSAQGSKLRLNATLGGTLLPSIQMTAANLPAFPFTLGAGGTWIKKPWVFGGEFYFAKGSQTQDAVAAQWAGFTNTLSIGYVLLDHNSWSIESTVGFTSANHQVIIEPENRTSFINLRNDVLAVSPALTITRADKNGMTTGIKFIYHWIPAGETEWKYKVSDEPSGFSDRLSSLVIQVTLGGVLTLGQSK